MAPYLAAFSTSLALAYLSLLRGRRGDLFDLRDKPRVVLYGLSAVPLVALLSFREGIGTDYNGIYVAGFRDMAAGEPSRFEIGYQLLQRGVLTFTDDYHVLFFVVALVTVGLTYVAMYRLSCNVLLSLVVYFAGGFFFFSTNVLRQCIAEAILLNALPYLINFKPSKYFILVVIASSFHSAALIFIPLVIFGRFRLGASLKLSLLVLLAILMLYGVGSLLEVGYLASDQFSLYAGSHYVEGDFDIADTAYFVFFFLCMLFSGRRDESSSAIEMYADLAFIGMLFSLLTGSAFILYRIARLFTPILIVAIPELLDGAKRNSVNCALLRNANLAFYCVSGFYLYVIARFDHAIPYESFLL